MTQYTLWIISYFSLYIAIVWLFLIYLDHNGAPKRLREYPSITVIVPAHNEERSIQESLQSLLTLRYPRDALRVIVINDGSTDRTRERVELVAGREPRVTLINTKKQGKAAALNRALRAVETPYVACVDADSHVAPDALMKMIPLFQQPNTGAVISAVKVDTPKTFYEKLQKIEYLIAIQARRVMASIDTLAMTPGVLSIYRTDVVRTVGAFDEKSITEDFEIALNLKYHGYNIQIAHEAVTYTKVPHNFVQLWRQRIRWYRGYIDTHLKYRDMFFSKRYGLFGWFQLPLNVIGFIMLVVAMALISYNVIDSGINFVIRSIRIDNYFMNHVLDFPSFRDFWLSQDMKIMLPIYVSLAASIVLLVSAYRLTKEKIRNPFSLWAYMFLLPYLFFIHWLGTFYEKLFRVKQRW